MKPRIKPYNYTEINNKFLLVNKLGKWVFLTKESFDIVKNDEIKQETELYNLLKSEEFISDGQEKYDFPVKKYSFLCQGPSLHILVLTDKCNLNCVYCQASSKRIGGKGMTVETAKKIIDFIFKTNTKHITIEFQGGEPLLNYKTLQFAVEYAKNLNLEHKKDLRFALVTNFESMTEEIMKYIAQNDIGLCTSFDGPKQVHDYQRKHVNSNYETIINWISKIRNMKQQGIVHDKFILNALITVTKKAFDYHKEIIDEYVKQGFTNIHLRHLTKLGSADKAWQEIGYDADEYFDYWKKSLDYIIELNKKNTRIVERFTLIILQKILEHIEPNYTELRSPCGACISQLTYAPNGKIYSCDEARMIDDDLFMIGTINQQPSDVIINDTSSSIVLASINDVQQCDDCVWQPYCGLCPVCNYSEHKSLIVDVNKTMRCILVKKQFEYIFEKLLFDEDAKKIFTNWLK